MSGQDEHEARMQSILSSCHLFEVSWEAGNKVGGIYTVLRTKAEVTVEEYGDKYCLIGVLGGGNSSLEVDSQSVENTGDVFTGVALERMQARGVRAVYGKWLVAGCPNILLFDLRSVQHMRGEWLNNLRQVSGISVPHADTEAADVVLFGYTVAWFLGEWSHASQAAVAIAHFHEWMGGLAALLLRARGMCSRIATIFTTHATLLGRYLCASAESDFYNNVRSTMVDAEAGRRGIYHRYCIERAAAHCATVFTTVSHITAYEAEHLLGRRPDGVLPNGLSVVRRDATYGTAGFSTPRAGTHDRPSHARTHSLTRPSHGDVVPTLHGPLLQRRRADVMTREEAVRAVKAFVQGHFYGTSDIDLDDTLFLFISGRYEFKNKGADMFLESLGRLNARLAGGTRTVVAFLILPAETSSYNVEALKGQTLARRLHATVSAVAGGVAARLHASIMKGNAVSDAELLSQDDRVLIKRSALAMQRTGGKFPPIVTHNMAHDATDPVLCALRRQRLFNAPTDRVKVVFHPEFISADNPVLGLDYDDFVRACDMGVFPSYYEPWGYTPAECAVMGVPSVTSNLSGFGCYVLDSVPEPRECGVYVVDRRNRGVEDSVQQLTDILAEYCAMPERERDLLRARTARFAEEYLDWDRLGLEYEKARYLAVVRTCRAREAAQTPSDHGKTSGTADPDANKLMTETEYSADKLGQADVEGRVRFGQATFDLDGSPGGCYVCGGADESKEKEKQDVREPHDYNQCVVTECGNGLHGSNEKLCETGLNRSEKAIGHNEPAHGKDNLQQSTCSTDTYSFANANDGNVSVTGINRNTQSSTRSSAAAMDCVAETVESLRITS